MNLKTFVVCWFVSLVLLSPVNAEVRALLVGVSDYTEQSEIPDLRGPRNDVLLMRDILKKRGANDITTLADGIAGAARPTRRAILNAMQDLSQKSGHGDLVYIHLSGHGSQQPDQESDETDGLDEVFLPADTGKAPNGSNAIENALTDDEIRLNVQAIRRTGADVWFVIDSCHSGSGMRTTTDYSTVRNVVPDDLGISFANVDGPFTPSNSASFDSIGDSMETLPGMGRYVAFYATKSNDVAREVRFDQQGDGSHWYGLFTSVLAAQLDGATSPTYRQVFQSLLSRLGRGAGHGVAVMQTPVWEGDLIDDPVLGGAASEGVQRFLVEGDRLGAGLVHGFPVGTVVALVADVTDPPDEVLGYAQVEETEPRQSYLRPVDRSCVPEAGELCAIKGDLSTDARAAQLELRPKNRTIRFSPVFRWDDGMELDENAAAPTMVSRALAAAAEKVGVSTKRSVDIYDVEVAIRGGSSLWFAPSTRLGSRPAGLEFKLDQDKASENLQAILERILRAELFAQTMDNLDQGNAFFNPPPVEVRGKYFSSNLSELSEPGTEIRARSECRTVQSRYRPNKSRTLEDGEDLKQCDILEFVARGTREGQRSVNRIYIDARYCITNSYELVEGDREERRVGPAMQMCSDCPGEVSYSAGNERMYFLISEFEDNREALNLTGLIENCTGQRNGDADTRSLAESELKNMLDKMGNRGMTRGEMGQGFGISNVWSSSLRWRILPRYEAFARSGSD